MGNECMRHSLNMHNNITHSFYDEYSWILQAFSSEDIKQLALIE